VVFVKVGISAEVIVAVVEVNVSIVPTLQSRLSISAVSIVARFTIRLSISIS
jgi:hypothetical protein